MKDSDRVLQRLCDRPEDRELWLVYGDALQAEGDPRGEAIALEQRLAQAPTPQLRRELKRAYDTIARDSAIGELVARGCWTVAWADGLIEAARFEVKRPLPEGSESEQIEALLVDPASRFLRRLEIHLSDDYHESAERGARAIASMKRPRLDTLHFGLDRSSIFKQQAQDCLPDDYAELIPPKVAAQLCDATPALVRLGLSGQALCPYAMQHAGVIQLSCCYAGTIPALAYGGRPSSRPFPSLRLLSLAYFDDYAGVEFEVQHVTDCVLPSVFPSLEALDLRLCRDLTNYSDDASAFGLLARSAILPQLKALALPGHLFRRAHAGETTQHAARFAHLQSFVASDLSRGALKSLKGDYPRLEHRDTPPLVPYAAFAQPGT